MAFAKQLVGANINYRRRVSKFVTNRTTARAKARRAEILMSVQAILAYSRAINTNCCNGVATSSPCLFADLFSGGMRIQSRDEPKFCCDLEPLLVSLGLPEPEMSDHIWHK